MNTASVLAKSWLICVPLAALDILYGTSITMLVVAVTLYENAWLLDLLDDIGV